MNAADLNSILYFAYGGNTNSSILRQRVGNAQPVGPAILHHWQLTFRLFSNVESHEHGHVHGMLWRIPRHHLPDLDESEALHRHYTRIEVDVERGQQYQRAITYIMEPDFEDYAPPSDLYLQAMMDGYKAHDLPLEQIRDALRRSMASLRAERSS